MFGTDKAKLFNSYLNFAIVMLQIFVICAVAFQILYNAVVYWYITISACAASYIVVYYLLSDKKDSEYSKFMRKSDEQYNRFLRREIPNYMKKNKIDPNSIGAFNIAKKELTKEYFSYLDKKKYY
jgi:hypothetical protein